MTKIIITRGLSILLALMLLFWLFHDKRNLEALYGVMSLSWPVVLAVVFTQTLSYLCRAGRLFSQFERRIALGFLGYLRISLIHNMSVNVIPFRGGEITLPLMLQRAGLSLTEAIATLIWLRIQDLFVLLMLAAWLWPGLPIVARLAAFLAIILIIFVIRVLVHRGGLPIPRTLREHPKLAIWVNGAGQVIDASTTSWLWSVSNWIGKLSGLAILLSALTDLTFHVSAGGVLGGELSALLPIQGVAGFGTYEAGVAFLLHLGDANWPQLFAAAFALHCLTLLFAVAAGCFAWFFLPSGKKLDLINRPSTPQP